MKKHRNFLVFYSIWLVAIMGVFVVFDKKSPDGNLKAKSDICTLADDHLQRTTTKAYENKKCNFRNL